MWAYNAEKCHVDWCMNEPGYEYAPDGIEPVYPEAVVIPALRAEKAVATVAGALAKKGAEETLNTDAASSAKELSKSAERGIRSLEKRIAEHEQKLSDFKANPTVRPGMEGQSESVIRTAQESRIRHLETEIQTFRANIEKLRGE